MVNDTIASTSTSKVGYPSAVAPGLPAFTIDVPAGWQVGEFPDALLAAIAPPAESGAFRPNLIVHGRRVPTSLTLEAAADGAVADLEVAYGRVDVGARDVSRNTGAELLRQTLGYRLADDSLDLGHLNVIVLLHDEIAESGLRSLLRLDAVCTAEQSAACLPIFHDMISSFEVERRSMELSGGEE